MNNINEFYREWKETKVLCTDTKSSIYYLLNEIELNQKKQGLTC